MGENIAALDAFGKLKGTNRMPTGLPEESNMGHITVQYGPYYRPIWAILPTNMGHITGPPPAPPQGRGAVRLSHKAYKTYKSYKTYKPSPLRGTEGGYQYESYYFVGRHEWRAETKPRHRCKPVLPLTQNEKKHGMELFFRPFCLQNGFFPYLWLDNKTIQQWQTNES